MINCQIFGICDFQAALTGEWGNSLLKTVGQSFPDDLFKENAGSTVDQGSRLASLLKKLPSIQFPPLEQADKDRIEKLLKHGLKYCRPLELDAACDRIKRFSATLRSPHVNLQDVISELRTLRETVEDGLKQINFYHYPKTKAQVLLEFENNWRKINQAFPSAKSDGHAAVDCYALGHYRASIFHSMMVLERGLQSFAKALRIRYGYRNWHSVIERGEKRISQLLASKVRKTTRRIELLTFYSSAAKEFTYFKEAWRNHTAHGRANYVESDAAKVLVHVHDFMAQISTRLKE